MARIEYVSEETLKKHIKEIAGRHLDLNKYKLFFFGSRVTNRGSEHSDIDVGILGNTSVPEKVLGQIKEDLEEAALLYSVDIVDFFSVSEQFKQVALQDIEYI